MNCTDDRRAVRSASNSGVGPNTSTPTTRVAPACSAAKAYAPFTPHMQPMSAKLPLPA